MQKDSNSYTINTNTGSVASGLTNDKVAQKTVPVEEQDTSYFTSDWSPAASPTQERKEDKKRDKGRSIHNEGTSEVYDDFEKMGLHDAILRGVFAYGFERPSVIQQRAIVPCIKGRDVVAQAQSGTGKTATFSIAMLQRLDVKKKHCQVCLLKL